MKKVLVIVIAVVLVFTVSITAFAATGEREKEVIGENKGAAVDVENREERTEKLRELFADYHPVL